MSSLNGRAPDDGVRLVYTDDPGLRHVLGGRWFTRRRLVREQERVLIERALEAGHDLPENTSPTAAGDPRKLRGLPAIGYSVSGAIPGTRPDQLCRHPSGRSCPMCRPSATLEESGTM